MHLYSYKELHPEDTCTLSYWGHKSFSMKDHKISPWVWNMQGAPHLCTRSDTCAHTRTHSDTNTHTRMHTRVIHTNCSVCITITAVHLYIKEKILLRGNDSCIIKKNTCTYAVTGWFLCRWRSEQGWVCMKTPTEVLEFVVLRGVTHCYSLRSTSGSQIIWWSVYTPCTSINFVWNSTNLILCQQTN